MFNLKSLIKNGLKFLFVAAVLSWMWNSGRLDLNRIYQALKNWRVILPGVLLLLCNLPILSLRLKWLLRGQRIPIHFLQSATLTFIGLFFNTTLPGAVSGDVVKGYYLIKLAPGLRKTQAITAMLVDRIVGLSGLIIVSTLALLFRLEAVIASSKLQSVAVIILGFALGVFVFFVFVLFPFGERFEKLLALLRKLPSGTLFVKFISALRGYRQNLRYLAGSLLISVFIHILSISAMGFFLSALGDDSLSVGSLFFLTPLGLITTAIPIAPAGLGVGHAAFLALFQLGGSARGVDAFSIFALTQILLGLTGALPYLLFKKPGENIDQITSEFQTDTPEA